MFKQTEIIYTMEGLVVKADIESIMHEVKSVYDSERKTYDYVNIHQVVATTRTGKKHIIKTDLPDKKSAMDIIGSLIQD